MMSFHGFRQTLEKDKGEDMGRGQHKNKSHSEKRKAYNERKKSANYPKGGYGKARPPYKNI